MRKPWRYWTKQKCKEEALKYKSRIKFKQNCGYGYDKSLKKGWLDEICSHMTRIGSKHYKCVYISIFEDKSVYVGITYSFQERKAAHLNLSGKKLSSVGKHILKTGHNPLIIKLTDYLNFEESVILEAKIYDLFKNLGWNVLNRIKTGSVGGKIFTWDKEKCKEEALKYKTRNDFMVNAAGAYDAANRHGWLNEITEHMLEYRKHRNYWTRKRCEKEYEKYNSIAELRKNSSGAYAAAYENGWHQDLKKLI